MDNLAVIVERQPDGVELAASWRRRSGGLCDHRSSRAMAETLKTIWRLLVAHVSRKLRHTREALGLALPDDVGDSPVHPPPPLPRP